LPHIRDTFLNAIRLGALVLLMRAAIGGEPAWKDGCDTVGNWRPLSGRPTPELAGVPEGHLGGAIRVRFFESSQPQVVGVSVPGGAAWDQAAGLSFWLKGDGSGEFIGVFVLDETFTQHHVALVGLSEREWRQVRVRWEDLVPETLGADWLGQPEGRLTPSGARALWLGRWFYMRPYSRCSFQVDEFRLEENLVRAPDPQPASAGLERTRARLRAHEPVRIVALGDSITAGARLDAPQSQSYPAVLQKLLRRRFGYDGISVLNRGVEGLEARQAIILLPRDVGAPAPDLAIVHLGYNDNSAMEERRLEGPARRRIAARNWTELVTRLRRATAGQTEVLLVATIPGADPLRRRALDFLGDEAEHTARELRCGFSAGPRAAFHKALEAERPQELFLRRSDGLLDPAHPGPAGQELLAEALMGAFE
jgi:lysophospholipase L1-like esterase